MPNKRKGRARSAKDQKSAPKKRASGRKNDSGEPGGGKGRRDEVGPTGVYPLSADHIPPDAEIRMAGSWGGGDYNEAGGSELVYRDGILLGGLTSGPDGEPTIDIHAAGNPAPDARRDAARAESGSDTGEAAAGESAPLDPIELRLRGLPKPEGSGDTTAAQGDEQSEGTQDKRTT